MAYCRLVDPATSPLTQLIRAQRTAQDGSRPTGLHLSRICDDFCKAIYPAKYRGLSEAASAGYQEIGNTFEDLLGSIFRVRFSQWHKPEPRRRSGVWGSPDGASHSTHTIDEIKATWASEFEFIELSDEGAIVKRSPKFVRYEMQILGYLYIWGWRRARLHVWFINGNWRPPRPEWPRTFILRYTQTEIFDNWRKLMIHARDRRWISATRLNRTLRYLREAA